MEKRVGGPTEVCNANKKARLSTDEERPRFICGYIFFVLLYIHPVY